FGMHLGTAFQLIDDVLDYSGDERKTGKHLGDDLSEGKPTLPLIHVMQHGNSQQSAVVRKAIEEGGREDFPAVIDAIRATGALGEARRRAQTESSLAMDALSRLPSSTYKDSLVQLTEFAVARNY
ncbi:MAG: polyprenyl synthetase family protein, partial [Candidatus Methylophosphatis roskildensis]